MAWDRDLEVNDMERLKIAVVGAGLIGSKHAALVNAHRDCCLVGVCDVDSSLQSVADAYRVAFYEDITDLLERERPDGAIIATPNGSHLAITEACAERSVQVLIEKPIAGGLADAHRIVEVADETGIRVLIGHHRRHNPRLQKARSIVNSDTLGRLVAVSVMWSLLKPDEYFDVDWRCRRPAGGPTLINLIHELDSLRFICGEIGQVYAQSSSAVRSLEVEDTLSISLSFDNGALGSVTASDASPGPWSYEATTGENLHYFHADENCYYFLGTSGSLAFPRMELWRYADGEPSGWQYPMEKSYHNVSDVDPLVAQLEHFCRVMRGEELPIVDGRDGTRSLAVALAILESAELQVLITLPPC